MKRIGPASLLFLLTACSSCLHAPCTEGPTMNAAFPEAQAASHPAIRPLPPLSSAPMGEGPSFFVHPDAGNDANPGSLRSPWRTVNHALRRLKAGDTLYLRGGTYFENVYCAAAGTPEKPITIRAYPGERATVDGGIPEFQTDPARAWAPCAEGVPGEYVSVAEHRNIRDVVGAFGDSNVGLQTYWYAMDLRSENERHGPEHPTPAKAVYCGPGLWYDKQTGRIHARLAHTRLAPSPNHNYRDVNYRGETDPRRLPLVVAPFNAVTLTLDQAMHVRFQDIVFRGGGYRTLHLVFGVDIAFDHCAVYGGTYPIWAKGTGPLTMTHCGVHGGIPPWAFRWENGLKVYLPHKYPPFIPDDASGHRNIARLPTHALLVSEGGYEFETFYYPHNHDWDIAWCEFSDGHDGVYLSGYNIRFHHNLLSTLQDDGIYISAPTPHHTHSVRIYLNYLTSGITAFGAHARGGPGGDIFVYRNVVDLRQPMHWDRPADAHPEGTFEWGHSAFFMHNSRALLHEENLHFYQNTLLLQSLHYAAAMGGTLHPDAVRRVFNNLCLYAGARPRDFAADRLERFDLQMDGNLHWHLTLGADAVDLEKVRRLTLSPASRKGCPQGLEAHALAADPRLVRLSWERSAVNDYRLLPESPAIGAGVVLPGDYEDPLRPEGGVRPDIGALPFGAEPLRVGIHGRITAGDLRAPD